MPGSVAVARQPLELKSLVRIQAGQPEPMLQKTHVFIADIKEYKEK